MEDLLLYISFDEFISWLVFMLGAAAPFVVINRVQLSDARDLLMCEQSYYRNINPILIERYPSLAPFFHFFTTRSNLHGDPYPELIVFSQ